MRTDLDKIYDELFAWCESEDFAGYDPFDGLNSRVFQATPLKYFALSRLAWLQLVKRSATNLRPLLKIEKGLNAKGIALFALAEISRFRTTHEDRHKQNAHLLLEKLLSLKIPNPKSQIPNPKSSWGYNFDWQSRVFYAPKGTPTIVPTAFAAQALIEGFQVFGEEHYLHTADEVCRFITGDLNRMNETEAEICFSYTPLDKNIIFNASLLAGEALANVGALTNNREYLNLAAKTANYVVNRQMQNGAWVYGAKSFQGWVDNFHTAFILLSLHRLQNLLPELQAQASLKNGLNFWIENLFLPDGTPKYYDRETYPVDIHSAAAAIVCLSELKDLDERCLPLAEKVSAWTIDNMRDQAGFFYYQKRRDETVKTPFIRWGQAWMAYALAKLSEGKNKV
jgi:hypothetical protein